MGPGQPNHGAWLAALSSLCMARSVAELRLSGMELGYQDLGSFPRLFPRIQVTAASGSGLLLMAL